MTSSSPSHLHGALWISNDANQQLASDQIDLLRAIADTGSISAAGRALGISYKTAWDRVDALNNMSRQPLVMRASGGAGGGGTILTDYGRNILDGFNALRQVHQAFIRELGHKISSLDDISHFMNSSHIRSSVGNQFLGTVTRIVSGAVNCEVSLQISRSQAIVAVISEQSRENLRLQSGSDVLALINPSWIILSTDTQLQSSARNRIVAPIQRVGHGAVNSEVTLDLEDGKALTVSVTRQSAAEMQLQEGQLVCALFKASSVILINTGLPDVHP